MKFFRTIRRIACLTAAMAVLTSACLAEDPYEVAQDAFEIAEEGLNLTESLSVYYPVLTGSAGKEVAEQVNTLIQEKCRIREYITRMPLLLSGDILFHASMGRTDLPGGSERDMAASLKRLGELPDDTLVLPGHNSPTTIGAERWRIIDFYPKWAGLE